MSRGVFPSQRLRDAIAAGVITAGDFRIPDENVQPASVDLRLGDTAYPLRCSFLPDSKSTVAERLADLAHGEIDLRRGATLEVDRPYLIPLREELRLPAGVWARTNPKSSTGRLDVFTRVITDRRDRFDEVEENYHGRLYLELVSRSFTIQVTAGLALNQLRLLNGSARRTDDELRAIHDETPLLFRDGKALTRKELLTADGLFLSVDLTGDENGICAFRAKKYAPPLDLTKIGFYDWHDYWEPVFPEKGHRMILQPDAFYLLLSEESVRVPPGYAAEMMAYDPTAGELRTHYAGFFDPGFGHDDAGLRTGTRAALEVRARDVPFMLEHRQPICKLAFERLTEPPEDLYGEDLGSTYQDQRVTLSKHFAAQTALIAQMRLRKFD